jgi:hypothetical protein
MLDAYRDEAGKPVRFDFLAIRLYMGDRYGSDQP